MTPQGIIDRAAAAFDIDVSEITGTRRQRHIARARQAAAWALRRQTDLSLVEIGRLLCREHTTVLYAVQKIDDLRQYDLRLARRLAEVVAPEVDSRVPPAAMLDRREATVDVFLKECGL